MDKDTFFDSQLWLFRLSDEEMEGLQKDFKFFTLLPDAYCCFQVDERLVFFTTDQCKGLNLECDATQLHLQVLLSLDENSDRDADCKRESAPGLYFVIDRQSYVVNHTLISKISVPNNSSGSIEPPSAFLDWPGLQMRWWLRLTLPPTVAIQKLSHAVKVMNKVLLPAFLSHGSISTAKLTRRQKSVTTSALWKEFKRLQDNDFVNEANKNASSSNSVSDENRPEGHPSTKLTRTDTHDNSNKTLTHDTSLQSVLLLERFECWVDFIEVTSRVLAKDVTSEIMCDSFLHLKPRLESQHVASMSALVSHNSASDLALPQNSYPVESAAQGALCSSECLSDQSATGGRLHKRPRQHKQPPHRSQQDTRRALTTLGVGVEGIPHCAAVASFVRGIMSGDEATRIEIELEGQRAKKEEAIQDQLNDLYVYHHQPVRDGVGRRKDDAIEDKDSQSRLLMLRIEALLGDMQGLVEGLAILRAMPRSADV